MLKRIDLILADRKRYTFEGNAAQEVSRCLEKKGVPYQILYLEDCLLHDYLSHIKENPPAWTVSFSEWSAPHKPLCEITAIPHFFWLEGSFAQAIPFLDANYATIGLQDEALCQKLARDHFVLLPPGVKSTIKVSKKEFDVVFFASLADPYFLEKIWQLSFKKPEIELIQQGIKAQDPLKSEAYYLYAEDFLKAKKTIKIVENFQQVALHIFGKHIGNDWFTRIPSHIRLHSELPYTEHFEVLRLSKIALIEEQSPWYFPSIAAGCLPLPPVQEKVVFYLQHPDEREKRVTELQEQLHERSWEKQVNCLLGYLK